MPYQKSRPSPLGSLTTFLAAGQPYGAWQSEKLLTYLPTFLAAGYPFGVWQSGKVTYLPTSLPHCRLPLWGLAVGKKLLTYLPS